MVTAQKSRSESPMESALELGSGLFASAWIRVRGMQKIESKLVSSGKDSDSVGAKVKPH